MEKIKIDKIIKKENIREDYGDLTELTESIREHGIRSPIELNSQNEIVDGHRRVIAAKAAGLAEVPFFYTDNTVDEKTSQMISGIFQKNLNPVEEGKAFKQYMESEEITAEQLATRISKRQDYIEKRLEIVKLPINVQNALIKKKIQIGHALLLARVPGEERNNLMKEIINEDLGVKEATQSMYQISSRLKDAPFCKNDCKNCIHNGSEQASLFETGSILSGECMNKKCFNKKLIDYIDEKRKEFADVLYEGNGYNAPVGFVDGSHDWECKENKITTAYKEKCRSTRENYLVSIDDYGRKTEFFKKRPQKDKPVEEAKTEEETKSEKKENALLTKVSEFKTSFLIEKTKENVKPGTQETKALGVLRMIQQSDYVEKERASEALGKLIKNEYGPYANPKNIFLAEEDALDNAIAALGKDALRKVDLKTLILISRNFDVDVKKDFVITEDYLKMYTKDQLDDLIVELRIESYDGSLKKAEIIEHILQQNLEGLVPKIML